jgi:hypothetical protein
MAPTQIDPEQPISWRVVPEDVPVRSSEGTVVGTVHDLLGSDEEDIFHGIVVRLADGHPRVFVPADDVTLLTGSHVDVDLAAAELAALPEHDEDRAFDLGWTGRFRKHVGWVKEKDR